MVVRHIVAEKSFFAAAHSSLLYLRVHWRPVTNHEKKGFNDPFPKSDSRKAITHFVEALSPPDCVINLLLSSPSRHLDKSALKDFFRLLAMIIRVTIVNPTREIPDQASHDAECYLARAFNPQKMPKLIDSIAHRSSDNFQVFLFVVNEFR